MKSLKQIYEELHKLKNDSEVKRYVELMEIVNKDESILSVPIYKTGLSPEFVKKAKKAGYSVYGELVATLASDEAQLEKDLGKDLVGELVLREKIFNNSVVSPGARISASA